MAATASGVAAQAQDDVAGSADDAFGSRIGQESIGLYSESMVRGFDLQQAGNYRIEDVYFVRAAGPTDAIVASSQIRVGASALPIDFPAPSGIVQYRLLPGERERGRIEFGFQHLLDSNPRPYLRGFFTRRSDDGRFSLSGGLLGSPSARYMFGNEARYYGVGLVPRLRLGEHWQITGFHGLYVQRYQADVGFVAADGVRLPQVERLRYLGQAWSRFDTRNVTSGAIVSSDARDNAWDYSLSTVRSRVDRPRSDFNLFTGIDAAGRTSASTLVARDRGIDSQALEGIARRDWTGERQRHELTLLARSRHSDYRNPRTTVLDVGNASIWGPVPQLPAPGDRAAGQGSTRIAQHEWGLGWRYQHRRGFAADIGIRRVVIDETVAQASGVRATRNSAQWLYNGSLVAPLSSRLTAFVAATRGIEEAGSAPENAANRFQVLPPVLARQSELGLKWQPVPTLSLIGTLFEIEKPEPGFDAGNVYRFLDDVRHRGVEVSLAGDVAEGLHVVAGASWMRMRLRGERVEAGEIGEQPVGRSAKLALASFDYAPTRWRGFSIDADATYYGPRFIDDRNRYRTPGYTLFNVGMRYRFAWNAVPAVLRLRVYNATDRYAWTVGGSGIQSYEPERRVMLSLALGE
ncbi:iron complex outermembrane receptor protein [Luteimonas cucumeris]|uniref:Iron complex outermembrane receptor protein n=1 Tax=Luteimonas cucumeris TaxID=985012 RepID=A0A562KYD7_9GAMM|nr:TonB-dependent receptor [Luteimonas cucumeris]TWI00276.1 iron complex outermembrane receptor protein [Luteimonas cucumeris]